MRRVLCGVVTAAVVAGLPFASTAGAASSADRTKPVFKSASTSKEVYALKPKASQDVVVKVRVTDNVGVSTVYAKLYGPKGGSPLHTLKLTRASGTAKDGTWQGTVPVKLNVSLGKWSIRAAAKDAASDVAAAAKDAAK